MNPTAVRCRPPARLRSLPCGRLPHRPVVWRVVSASEEPPPRLCRWRRSVVSSSSPSAGRICWRYRGGRSGSRAPLLLPIVAHVPDVASDPRRRIPAVGSRVPLKGHPALPPHERTSVVDLDPPGRGSQGRAVPSSSAPLRVPRLAVVVRLQPVPLGALGRGRPVVPSCMASRGRQSLSTALEREPDPLHRPTRPDGLERLGKPWSGKGARHGRVEHPGVSPVQGPFLRSPPPKDAEPVSRGLRP